MLNSSFVEHCSDSVRYGDGEDGSGEAAPAPADTARGRPRPEPLSFSSLVEESDGLFFGRDGGSSTSPQAYSDILKRWFSGMTHDVDEDADDSDGTEYSSAASEGILDLAGVGEPTLAPPPELAGFDDGADELPCANCPLDNLGRFTSLILAVWDNVLGPANKHVWWRRAAPPPPSFVNKLLPFHPACTLNGEVSRVDSIGKNGAEYKFYVLPEVGYAMGSFIFTAEEDEPPYALSLVVPLTELSAYLSIQKLTITRMRHLVKKLQILLKLDSKLSESTILGFTDLLVPFLTSIGQIGIPSPISDGFDLQRTAFGDGNCGKFSPEFLALAITAHLESGGVSIVLGDDVSTINMMVETLAIFLHEDECKQSRFAYDTSEERCYAPDLILQGLIQEKVFDPDVLMRSTMPSTVINTKTKLVQQANRAEHLVRHAEAEEAELQLLETSVKDTTAAAAAAAVDVGLSAAGAPRLTATAARETAHRKEILRHAGHEKLWDVRDKSPMVMQLLQTVGSVAGDGPVCQKILQHFCVGINRKANMVIQVVNAYQASSEAPIAPDNVDVFRRSVGLTNEADYDIVLAAAEKLRSGTYSAMKGDPLDMQDKVLGLFATF
mmetsp:Transcript_15697/g.40633  ORF Transcript_15697/g.40633 Transcript_15697/m.40633 type:complete len:609 (+) Transcript_15697:638-2464(+)